MFKLEFATDNSAFEGHAGPYEAARIVADIARQIEQDATRGLVYDLNGNRIGEWSLSFSDDD